MRRPSGIGLRIAGASLAVATVAVAVLSVGVIVVGGQTFADLMAVHGQLERRGDADNPGANDRNSHRDCPSPALVMPRPSGRRARPARADRC